MRNVLIIALFLIGLLGKAQIVGGFVPLNSTKSFTTGMHIIGTPSYTDANRWSHFQGSANNYYQSIWQNTSSGTSASTDLVLSNDQGTATTFYTNLGMNSSTFTGTTVFDIKNAGYLYTQSSPLSLGTRTTQSIWFATNNVNRLKIDSVGRLICPGTFSLGSGNLTGGNTGTVAVLSDALFQVTCMSTSANLADATSYYIGNVPANTVLFTTAGWSKVYIPYNCTLVGWTANFADGGTVASAESSTLSISIDGSLTTLNSAISMSVATGVNTYSASGLSTTINAGSFIEARLVTPTWVTNPTSVSIGITFWFVRRQ